MNNFSPLIPLLIPSFSSKGNLLIPCSDGNYVSDNYDLLQVLDVRVSNSYLVSAYDIFYGYMPQDPNEWPNTDYLFIDSGGYEISDTYDLSERNKFNYKVHPWDIDKMKQSFGHKQLYEKHQLAGKMYAQAKLDLASKLMEWDINPVSDDDVLAYLDDHYNALNDLPQIPEKHFGRLKHAHQSKVELSKFLDSHPNDFWLVCKIKFRLGIDLPSQKKGEKVSAAKDSMNS